jgi:tetratricopeptide (TPR) repeat protein
MLDTTEMPFLASQNRSSTTLKGKRIAFTGKLASMHREELVQLIKKFGGTSTEYISQHTNILIVGTEGWPVLKNGEVSKKLQKAEVLNESKPGLIEIISEYSFLERIGLKKPRRTESGTCSVEHAAKILGVDKKVLRRWEQFDLIHSHKGKLPFQDLVSLRTITGLVQQDITPAHIAKGLQSLARILDIDRPLAQIRLIAEMGHLIAEFQGKLLELNGQLMFNFNSKNTTGETIKLLEGQSQDADDWLEYGSICEDEGRWIDAEMAFKHALALDAELVEAHLNLGNIFYKRGLLDKAAKHFFQVAELNKDLASLALYNLSDVLEQLDKHSEAAEALQLAIKAEPTFAAAYFKLALCYEHLHQPEDANKTWEHYLKLDPENGEAQFAYRHIKRNKLFKVYDGDE